MPDRRALAVLLLLLLPSLAWALSAVRAQPITLATGRLTPTIQESQECVFPIGQGTAVLLRPVSDACLLLRTLEGQTGTLLWVPDP